LASTFFKVFSFLSVNFFSAQTQVKEEKVIKKRAAVRKAKAKISAKKQKKELKTTEASVKKQAAAKDKVKIAGIQRRYKRQEVSSTNDIKVVNKDLKEFDALSVKIKALVTKQNFLRKDIKNELG